jgi:hypothetical protein
LSRVPVAQLPGHDYSSTVWQPTQDG